MLFIRACDAALFLSVNAALRRLRSLMRDMIACHDRLQLYLTTGIAQRISEERPTHLLLFAQFGRPPCEVPIALLLLALLFGLAFFSFSFFFAFRALACLVSCLHELLLAFLLQAVLVQLRLPQRQDQTI